MSIASRITAIEEHIRDVYDTIDYSYDTTDVDKNIINIPQNIFNGYINVLNDNGQSLWNNLEKVSASGEEATLENVETAPMKMVLNGNTSQDTTTGKNLIDDYDLINRYNVASVSGNIITSNAINSNYNVIQPRTKTQTINLIENTDYYVSFDCRLKSGSYSAKLGTGIIDGVNGTSWSSGNTAISNPNMTGSYQRYSFKCIATITTNSIIGLTIQVQQNLSDAVFEIKNIMISTSSNDTYEPYTGGQPSPSPDFPQQVKVVTGENVVSVSGKNLFDKDNQAKIQVNAEGTLRYGIIVNAPNKKVSISGKNWSGYIAYKPLTNGVYGQWVNTNRDTTINVTDKLIIYSNGDTIKLNTYVDDLQIEISDVPTDYVPYSKTDYPISLGTIEMCKIGDYKDYLFKRNGKWYVHKEINTFTLDGSQNITYNTSTSTPTERTTFRWNLPTIPSSTRYFSNRFIYNSSTSNRIVLVANTRAPYMSIDNTIAGINVEDANATKVSKMRTWLSTNNVTLYYVLATPTEEEITNTTLIEQLEAISNAKSVKDKTYITQTNDELPFILDVEAIKEYEVN